MFFFFFLFSFALSFLFFFFSFYYKNLHKQQQQQQQEGKTENEPALLNRSLSDIVDKKPQTRENDPTHLHHSLLLEILPFDSTKWAGLFTGENQRRGDKGQVGSGREVERCESESGDQRTKKKKKRGKKKRFNSKGEEENGEERCSSVEEEKKKREESGQGCPRPRLKPELVCLYPFTSTSSATQRKIKQQYDQLVKCHENKGLTLAQVGEFANCLIEARNELQHKSEVIKRKFTITKALLFKADRSSFDRLRQQIFKLEMEQKRLEEDAFVYNWLQQQLKLSPAYKKMLEIGACMELKSKSGELMEGTDTEFADISFEELLAQEKKDSFWQKNGKSRLSSN
ncbi:F11A6.1 protein, putative [Theobroma cacao]|uniref:F11A6.1 protein, putative n=1 Tax=Theobroma cacao TaxID=3641 RepID=A0A061GCF3_THECC|nr:F11A6.1 protein, putative [Theobroma cacao]